MTKVKLDEGDKFENFVNYASKVNIKISKRKFILIIFFHQTEYELVGEPDIAQLKKGDIIQILRKGYYICDAPYDAKTQQPCRLLNIPDGASKDKPTGLKTTTTAAAASGDASGASATTTTASGPEVDQLIEQIVQQGEQVRQLKANKSTPKVKEI